MDRWNDRLGWCWDVDETTFKVLPEVVGDDDDDDPDGFPNDKLFEEAL